MATVSGVITDANGGGIVRILRCYKRSDGTLLGETLSAALDGAYSFTVPSTAEVQVIMLDDSSGSVENDQILRTIPV